MCGIAGYMSISDRSELPDGNERLFQQIRTLTHRGPDAQRVWNGHGIGLAHARLSIIDLSESANQPMASADGQIVLVFNGEIYNFSELRKELETLGAHFDTHSDTETILRGYEAWGLDVVERLRGMFAFALWDGRQERLVLVRDRVGKKPLYYTHFRDRLIFASEIKGILAWPGMERTPNLQAIHEYLTYQYVPSPLTAFEGIHKLPPAHMLLQERGKKPYLRQYFSLPEPRSGAARPLPELREELVHHLREATRLRLIADVPVGAFLSGGVDSSAIVAMMALESTARVKTFTIGFEEQVYDERPYAQAVVDRYDTEHHEYIVRPDGMDILPRIVWHYGEPFADSSAIPTYYVSEVARRNVTVALNGDGGDESFLGYPRYVNFREWAEKASLPAPAQSIVSKILQTMPASWSPTLPARALRHWAGRLHAQPSRRYQQAIAFFGDEAKEPLYGERMQGYLETSPLDRLDPYLLAAPTPAAGAAWADIHTYLPDDLLVKVDVASMAHSLECRSPFLDHVLMEWAASLPEDVKLQGSETKALLKQAMEPYLPHDLLYRPKMGFGVPIDRWLKGEMRDFVYEVLLSQRARERGLFRPEAVRQLLDLHCSGHGHAPRIWALLMLELWFEMWIDGACPSTPPVQSRLEAALV
ncbi:asparagine synthase (glutamine-hydrolyzing) [Afifella pfennigii]|uniref:asparagine synthase (glutamine-hydrolyzing) n=1 Tax=Afifella pfennigii TaxID=209897 RepID=UPI000692360E|nr:asparagine synthase (glutamine-hydrolyzing) [Afifella pfennigii]